MKHIFLILVFPIILSGCISGLGIGGGGGPKADGEFVEGAIVSGFPPVPGYPEAIVIESYGEDNNFGVASISDDSVSEVVNFYGQALAQLGWQYTLNKHSDSNFEYEINNDMYNGRVIINTAADGERTAISASLEQR